MKVWDSNFTAPSLPFSLNCFTISMQVRLGRSLVISNLESSSIKIILEYTAFLFSKNVTFWHNQNVNMCSFGQSRAIRISARERNIPLPCYPTPPLEISQKKMFAFTLKTTWMVNGNTSYLLNLVYHTNKLSENFLYSNRPALKSVPSKLCLLLLWLVLYKEKLIVKDSQGKGNLSWSGIELYKWVPGI